MIDSTVVKVMYSYEGAGALKATVAARPAATRRPAAPKRNLFMEKGL
jgi:hypothetical protein